MDIQNFDCGFPYIVVDNLYDENELNIIWQELDFLSYSNKLQPPMETGSEVDLDGNFIKSNSGIFLEEIFSNLKYSNIFKVNRKLFNIGIHKHPSWFFKHITYKLNYDSTLISYYDDGDYYAPHRDESTISTLTWLYREPKRFEGGDLYFTEYNECVRVKNNRALIFPGCIQHAVDNVSMEKNYRGKYLGRYCLTNFIKRHVNTL